MNKLKRIKPAARALITLETYGKEDPGLFEEYITGFERDIDIDPLLYVLAQTMDKYTRDERDQSDAWLSPRVHACLRLYRREAADLSIWEYLSLAVDEVRDYIRWRWSNREGFLANKDRVYGSDRRHALARLWWVAELTRNGPDYSHTEKAFTYSQDMINYLTDVDFSHNRAAALGYIQYFAGDGRDTKKAKDSVSLGKSLNHVLTTIILDKLVVNPGIDQEAYQVWVSQKPDETLMIHNMPEGPNEPQVPEEHIKSVIDLFASIESRTPVFEEE